MNDKSLRQNKQTKTSPIVFKLLAIAIPFLILFVFEGILKLSKYGENYDLFIQNPTEGFEDYYIVNPHVGAKYFQQLEYTSPANDIFLKKKPENTKRIFVLGSSTVYGFPYERNLMFSRILHKRLTELYPEKSIEVVNCAITAINSFTLRDYASQITKHEPDAVLIYTGHNEFYGAFGIGSNETMGKSQGLTQAHLRLMNLKIYQLLRKGITAIGKQLASSTKEKRHGTLMKRIVGNEDIVLNDKDYTNAMISYENNMSDIIKTFNKKGIPVFLSEVVSNVKDLKPFNSVETESQPKAIDVYEKAKVFEENGDFEQALKLYNKARDLDCIRFRASSEVNEIINKLAIIHNTHIIPMEKYFQDASPNRLIGNNLMTEHVHPNIDGQFLMAEAFFREIVRSKAIGIPEKSMISSMQHFRNNWGYSSLDRLIAFHRIELMKHFWPFVTDQNDIDYRNTYHPKNDYDSIAFMVVKYSDVSQENIRIDLAKKYEEQGQFEKALKEYLALQCASPYMPINNRDVAKTYVKLNDLPAAISYFTLATLHSDNYYDFFKLGELLLIKGDYEQAIYYFRKAYELGPDDKKMNILLKTYVGLTYLGDEKEAENLEREIRKIKPNLSFEIPKKQYLFDQYIPTQTKTYIRSAQVALNNGNKKEAIDILEKSLSIYESHIALRYLGEIYFGDNDYKTAFFYFSRIYDIFQFDIRFLHNYTILLAASNQLEQAKDCIARIENMNPSYAGISQLNSIIEGVKNKQIKPKE